MKSKTVFILIVILSIILCALSGCSDKTSTSTGTPIDAGTTVDKESFDEYVAYNSLERLKADGGNYKYDNYIFENDQLVFTSSQYWDSDKLLQEFDNGMIFFYYDDISFYRSQNDGEWVFNPVLFGPDGLDNFALIEPIFVPEEEELIETASSDEQFIAVTELTEKKYIDYYTYGEYEEGMGLRCKYTFDKNTKELLELETTAFYPDGSTHIYDVRKYSYNVDFPDPLESEDTQAYVDAAKDPEQCRDVKVTYGPGTDEEQTIEYSIPKGHRFHIFTDDFVSEIYTDRECTKLYERSVDADNDLELFVPLG